MRDNALMTQTGPFARYLFTFRSGMTNDASELWVPGFLLIGSRKNHRSAVPPDDHEHNLNLTRSFLLRGHLQLVRLVSAGHYGS